MDSFWPDMPAMYPPTVRTSVAAVAVHLWALLAEWGAFLENGRLMADPAAYARVRPAR